VSVKPASVDPVTGEQTLDVSWQFASTKDGNVELNANIYPDPTVKNIKIGNDMLSFVQVLNWVYGTNLNADSVGALTFLHELSHIVGRPNDQNDLAAANAFNEQVISKCLN